MHLCMYDDSMNIEPVFSTPLGRLYEGDCLPWLRDLDDESVDLVFADPPFNLNKNYGNGFKDNLSEEEYLSWTLEWVDECVRVIAPGGALWIYNIPRWSMPTGAHLLQKRELTFKHQVAISMKTGLPIPNKLSPAHYSALYFIKGKKPKAFSRPRTPIEVCRHCGKEIKDYGGHRSKMNPEGVNLTDVWTDLSPVRHRGAKHRSANALPEKMLERILTISSVPGDLVLDPFGGSGTTYAVAERMHRRWLGIELSGTETIVRRLQGEESLFEMPNRGDAGRGLKRS
ncbi:site-specific DNA-methyltransferase [Micrococcus luteus]|nr:site-specific DNA-methyltransferase [Micrococcus luteus]